MHNRRRPRGTNATSRAARRRPERIRRSATLQCGARNAPARRSLPRFPSPFNRETCCVHTFATSPSGAAAKLTVRDDHHAASTRAVVARGLAASDRSTKLAAVAVAVDEGVDTCAPELYRYIATPDADPLVVERIREVCTSLPETSDDEWIANLRAWAAPEPAADPVGGSRPRPQPAGAGCGCRRDRSPHWSTARRWRCSPSCSAGGSARSSGFPKGYDAWGHIAKVHLILEHWPYVDWNDALVRGDPALRGLVPAAVPPAGRRARHDHGAVDRRTR